MQFDFTALPATFVERPNRFRVVARLHESDEVVNAHCPNPGRLRELLIPGATIYVSKALNSNRKTPYDLRFVEHPESGVLVSLDTRLPNDVAEEALASGAVPLAKGYRQIEREVTLASERHKVQSRIDFRLTSASGERLWIEVKSVSLVEEGIALFPDAPTERGRRHLEELVHVIKAGDKAAVLFIVQRADAHEIRPHWETDPAFGDALAAAQAAGVMLVGYTCQLTTKSVGIDQQVPIKVIKPKEQFRTKIL